MGIDAGLVGSQREPPIPPRQSPTPAREAHSISSRVHSVWDGLMNDDGSGLERWRYPIPHLDEAGEDPDEDGYQGVREIIAQSPGHYRVADTITFRGPGGRAEAVIRRVLSSGFYSTILLVHVLKAPARWELPDKPLVLRLFDWRNRAASLEYFQLLRGSIAAAEGRPELNSSPWSEQWDQDHLDYSKTDEAEKLARCEHWRSEIVGFEARRRANFEFPHDEGVDFNISSRTVSSKDIGRLTVRNQIQQNCSFKQTRKVFDRLKQAQGRSLPRLYQRVCIDRRPEKEQFRGCRVPEVFFVPGLLMEYIDGPTLEEMMEAGGSRYTEILDTISERFPPALRQVLPGDDVVGSDYWVPDVEGCWRICWDSSAPGGYRLVLTDFWWCDGDSSDHSHIHVRHPAMRDEEWSWLVEHAYENPDDVAFKVEYTLLESGYRPTISDSSRAHWENWLCGLRGPPEYKWMKAERYLEMRLGIHLVYLDREVAESKMESEKRARESEERLRLKWERQEQAEERQEKIMAEAARRREGKEKQRREERYERLRDQILARPQLVEERRERARQREEGDEVVGISGFFSDDEE